MKSLKAFNVDEYIDRFPVEVQKKLQQIRRTIHKAVPNLEERIRYGFPTFAINGHNVLYLAGHKNHIGLYPAPRENPEFKEVLAEYEGGKGTVQFPYDRPLPLALIAKIARFGVDNLVKAKMKQVKKSATS